MYIPGATAQVYGILALIAHGLMHGLLCTVSNADIHLECQEVVGTVLNGIKKS